MDEHPAEPYRRAVHEHEFARHLDRPLLLQRLMHGESLPAAILGHANGRIKGGQHVKYPQDSRLADLLVTLFDRNNIPVEKLGDSGGTLSEI